MEPVKRITLIGGGLMGHGIGQEFACYGLEVSIFDDDPAIRETVLERIETNLVFMAKNHLIFEKKIKAILAAVQIHDTLEAAVENADVVIEAISENLPLKKGLFKHLDRVCPRNVILASNSSSFTPSQYAGSINYPDRVLGTHYFNPPYLIPLVEVVKGEKTGEKTLKTMIALLKGIGKRVVVVKKEVPGFIANRIQIALFREAFNVVEQGIASPEEVDMAIKSSFGRRLGVMGPFEQCDIIGADLKLSIYNALVPEIKSDTKPSRLLLRQIKAKKLGVKTGEGFYRWTKNSRKKRYERIQKALIAMNKMDNIFSESSGKNREPEDKGKKGK